jgi:hypothetical protein
LSWQPRRHHFAWRETRALKPGIQSCGRPSCTSFGIGLDFVSKASEHARHSGSSRLLVCVGAPHR